MGHTDLDDEEASAICLIIECAVRNLTLVKLELRDAGYTPEVVARACTKIAAIAGIDPQLEADDLR